MPELEHIWCQQGQVLMHADSPLDKVFFPDGVVSVLAVYCRGSQNSDGQRSISHARAATIDWAIAERKNDLPGEPGRTGAPDGHHRRDGAQAETGPAGPLEAVTSTRPWLPWPRFSPSPDHNLPWDPPGYLKICGAPAHKSSIVEIEPFTVAVQAELRRARHRSRSPIAMTIASGLARLSSRPA